MRRPRGRWAPSPSGHFHLGSARTALVAWLSIRHSGGTFVWRLEDLDPPRVMPGAAEGQMEDLAWLGLDWDEGCRLGGKEEGPFGPYSQSCRSDLYERALRFLAEQDRLFPCRRTRKDLQSLATAPHGSPEGLAYPDHLRPRDLPANWFEDPEQLRDAALRFRVDGEEVRFRDLLQGEQAERVDRTVGHFVLKRRDGLFAYQLAVVVDDLTMEIDEVVRGADLLASTAQQIQLARNLATSLGGKPPIYGHVPLVLAADGEKLSKRNEDLTLRSLREAGVDPRAIVGYLAWSLGLLSAPRRCVPADLVEGFGWERLRREDHVLPEDPLALIRDL